MRQEHALATPAASPGTVLPAVRHDQRGEAFSVRVLLPADRAALEGFYAEFEPKRAAQGLPPAGAVQLRRWLDVVLAGGLHLAAFRGDMLIGHALVSPTARGDTGEYAIFLRAADRGRGVGTVFSRLALEAARAGGFRRLWLSVESANRAAIRSYQKVGFRFLPGATYSTEPEMEVWL